MLPKEVSSSCISVGSAESVSRLQKRQTFARNAQMEKKDLRKWYAMASDGQCATKRELILCDPKVRGGMTICFSEGKCQSCKFAQKYEHPEEVKA